MACSPGESGGQLHSLQRKEASWRGECWSVRSTPTPHPEQRYANDREKNRRGRLAKEKPNKQTDRRLPEARLFLRACLEGSQGARLGPSRWARGPPPLPDSPTNRSSRRPGSSREGGSWLARPGSSSAGEPPVKETGKAPESTEAPAPPRSIHAPAGVSDALAGPSPTEDSCTDAFWERTVARS